MTVPLVKYIAMYSEFFVLAEKEEKKGEKASLWVVWSSSPIYIKKKFEHRGNN